LSRDKIVTYDFQQLTHNDELHQEFSGYTRAVKILV